MKSKISGRASMIQLTWWALALAWLVLAAHSFDTAWAQPTAEEDAIYAYTDDRGRLVHAQRLLDVPMHLRRSARRVDLPSAPPSAADGVIEWLSGSSADSGAQEPALYRVRGARGQEVFTNIAANVPPEQRAGARVDLSHVPLNSELGSALNQKLQERFEALRTAGACSELRSEAELGFLPRAWRDHRIAVVCALILLLLLLLSPWMHSRGWGGQWARVLWTGVPLLGFVALSGSVLMKANASLSDLTPRAERCQPSAFEAAPGLKQRFSLVSALESQQAQLAEIEREAGMTQR
jgi:hypothetical protein